MSKEILKRQLDEIKGSINNTLEIIRRLLQQASSVGDLINTLSAAEVDPKVIATLTNIKEDLDRNINDLIKSLDKLFDEYQEFIDNTL